MKILAIDTTTKFLCLGIYDAKRTCEYNLEVGKKLSTLLSPTIKRALLALGLTVNDIDYFACGIGPGSFTGVRVGLATIKGLSWVLKKPVIGISTLDILARNVGEVNHSVIPIIDAKRNLIYCSMYTNRNGELARIKPYMLLNKDELCSTAKPNSLFLGDALSLYRETLQKEIKGVTLLDKDYWYPKAHNIIELALKRIKEKRLDSCFNIKPIYLYPKECQIRRVK